MNLIVGEMDEFSLSGLSLGVQLPSTDDLTAEMPALVGEIQSVVISFPQYSVLW